MKILLFGANGQLGWELQRSLAPLGRLKICTKNDVNLENFTTLRRIVRESHPNIIVNAAAYTSVDKAESNTEKAFRINAEAVDLLADEAKSLDAWLVHYSTDYVFDGTKTASYVETDQPNPLNIYGKSKLQSEEVIKASACKQLIFRTSWIYGVRGRNFATSIIRLAKERDELKVVADQIGSPTSAELIADVTALCLYRLNYGMDCSEQEMGLYHLTSTGAISWHGFARYLIVEAKKNGIQLRMEPDNILPIRTDEYPLPAKRPANSRLRNNRLKEVFGIELPQWEVHCQKIVAELSSKTP